MVTPHPQRTSRSIFLASMLLLWTFAGGCAEDNTPHTPGSEDSEVQTGSGEPSDATADVPSSDPTDVTGEPTIGGNDLLPAVPFEAEVIGTRDHAFNEGVRTFTKLRLTRSDGEPTFALWVQATGEPGPAVLTTQPYDGIDWSGEDVDERWAAQAGSSASGQYDDIDGPDWDEATSRPIPYGLTPFDQLAEGSNAWLLNDVSVLMVFGRFYAGDPLDGYVRDVVAGLEFLAGEPGADNARIGIAGGSWGGFMALYGAALLPEGIPSVSTVAYYPPVDFPRFTDWIDHGLPDLLDPIGRTDLLGFFEPYLRRIRAAERRQHAPPMNFTDEWVCSNLGGPAFVVHDEHDTLVPYGPVRELADRCPGIAGAWYRRPDAIDWGTTPLWHGPLGEDPVFPAMFTLGIAWQLDRLLEADRARIVLYREEGLRDLLENARDSELRGEDVSWVTGALMPLTAQRMQLIEFTDPANPGFRGGREALAALLAEVWEEEVTEASIRGWLQRFVMP